MLSEIPKDLKRVSKEQLDMEIARRIGMIAELDAVNLMSSLLQWLTTRL